MKKKRVIIITLLCFSVAFSSICYIVSDSMEFSDGDYIVYIPDGAPENVWVEKDVYYVTSQMSFEYANELLLEKDYEQFRKVFFSCYDKFFYDSDIYYSIRKVFLKDKNEYNTDQQNVLLTCLEELYQNECQKENNLFLSEKNIMLQIELNRSFGNYIRALSLYRLIKA